MNKKLIKKLGDFRVVFDYDWQEFQIFRKGQKKATYHTDDKRDAIDTLSHMFLHQQRG